ncbi:MAG TPA: type II toxin-antitoxin system RelE/ParE family toxin [Candidatus Paceibacterota bacterium]
MIVSTHRSLDKLYKKLPFEIKDAFKRRKDMFIEEPFHPLLANHPLTGEWEGSRSINITGDYRAIYAPLGEKTANFIAIGTHHQLFGS